MANIFGSLWDDTKRDVLNPLGHAAGNVVHAGGNVVHAVAAAPTVINRDVARPVVRAVENAPQTFRNDVVAPVQRDFVRPVLNLPQTVNNDFVKPVNRDFVQPVFHLPQTINHDVWQPINRDVLHPIYRAPQNFINDVSDPVDRFVEKSSIGRGATAVGLGALRGATGLAQGLSGLYDIAGHQLGGKGTSRFDKALNHLAKSTDTTVSQQHYSKPLYYGGQVAANVLPFAVGVGEAAEGANAASKASLVGRALAKGDQFANDATKSLRAGNVGQRIVGNTVKNVINPRYQAANIGFTGLQTGQQAAKGQKVTPASVATNLAIGGVGFPVAGATAHEVASPVIQKAAQALKEAYLMRPANISDAEVAAIAKMRDISGTGASMGQDQTFQTTYNALRKAGISPNDITAIDNLLGEFRTYYARVQQRAQVLQEARQRLAVNNEIGAIGKNVTPEEAKGQHPIAKAFESHYTPSRNISPEEQSAANHIRNNPNKALVAYNKRVKGKFGSHKVVAGDEAKHIIPGFDATKSITYHEPGSALAKVKYDMLLRNPKTRNQMVHIMSGGTGAGKTSALLRHFDPNDYAATIDTNGNKLDSAVKKIETALKSGRNVEYTHVHRDPIEAFREGVIPRTAKEGRLVTPEAHIDTHYGSNEVFQKLRELYNDNPNIRFNLLGNKTNEIPTVLENVPQMRYNRGKAYQQLIKEVENAYKQGKITKAERDVYLGKANTAAPKPEQNTGKSVSTEPNRPVRQEVTKKAQDIQKALDKPNLTPKQRQTLSAALEKEKAKASVAAGIPQKTLAGKVARGESRTPSRTTPIALSKTSQEAPLKSSSIKDIQASGSRQKLLSQPQTAKSKIGPKPTSHLTSSNSTLKQRGFTTSVKNSDEVSPTTRKNTSGSYEPRSTAKMALLADKYSQGGLKRVTSEVNDSLAKKTGTISDQEIANAIAVAKRNDAKGNFDAAQQIYDRLAEHGTKGGQQIQAFSLLRNRTPEGLHHSAIRQLKKVGVELDKTEQKELSSLIEDLRKTKIGTKERDVALHNVVDFVDRRIPSGLGEKLVNFWRAGLLTSPVTTGGNILGNATEAATRNLWTNPTATAIDKFFSLFTGKRTKTLTGGQLAGAKTGTTKGLQYLKTGFDERRAPNEKFDVQKRRVNFKNPILDKYVNGVYRWMGAQDQPFYYAAEKQAARDLATADAKNLKLKGQARIDYIRNAQSDPNWKPQTFKSKSTQKGAGEYAVYQNSTLLGHMAGGLKKYASEHSGVGGAVANFLLPFSQVPSSVAMRIVDRTPLGIAKEVVSQIKNRSFDQRAMSEAVANGTFALPVVAAGAALAKSGLITGAYPTDPKERKLWQSEGKQEYSVKVGNRWYSLNYMQPFGTLLAIGGQFQNDIADGKTPGEAWNKVGATALNSVENQSFLQGINGVLSAVNDPNRSASQYITSTASSVAPNFIRTAARATDPQQRDTKGAIQGVQGAIPGLREKLPAKQDMFGKNLPAYDNAANQMFNPLRPDIARNQRDPVLNELQRLQDTQNGIIPTQFDKSSISGVKLNDQQVRQLNALVNPKVYTAWESIIADPRYKALSDEDKATALKQAKDKIADAYKRQFMANNNIPITKAATASELGILSGQKPDYLAQTSVASSSATPMQKYQAALANYNSNSKNLSPVDKYKAQQSLVKLKVEAPYSNDIITLHGMSKTDASNWLSTPENGVDKAKMAKQLIAYDQALYNAGLEKTLKYKYGIAPSSSGSRSGSSNTSQKTLNYDILRLLNHQKPVKYVGAATSKSFSLPKFVTPPLRRVYTPAKVVFAPTVSVKRAA